MPSSYTAPLYEAKDITFEEFVLRCARGMGATIMLRDHSLDVLPTEENVIEASSYNADRLEAAMVRLSELEAMTTDQAAEAAEAEFEEAKREFRLAEGDYYGLKRRYEKMRERVVAWEPPTEEHIGLKDFMLSQLDESIKFDLYEPKAPERCLSAAEWLKREMQKAERDVIYNREECAKKDERNAGRRVWVKDLRNSLESVLA